MKKLLLISLTIVFVIGLILVGCTKTTTTPSSVAQSVSTPPSSIITPTAITSPTSLIPKYGGTLKILVGNLVDNIGWPASFGAAAQGCLENLLRMDPEGNITPWLAESYKMSDDLKSITFNLRKGIKFHDGSDFNAEVAKWNLDNMINARMEPYWASVDVIDDYTIRVNFTEWVNNLPASFTDGVAFSPFMVSKMAFEKNGIDWMRSHSVGTGPFKFESFQQSVKHRVVRNPDYWVKGKPYLDALEYINIADTFTQGTAMKAGEGDISTAEIEEAADYTSLGFTMDVAGDGNYVLVPDTANADSPWAKKEVREAVEYAIDREGIAQAFGYGYWQAPYQIPPLNNLAYDPNFALARKYDLNKAKQLLLEAGYPDGFKTTMIVANMVKRDVAIAVQADLAKIGIQVNFDFPDMGKFGTYMSVDGTWHNAALFEAMPPTFDPTCISKLQFILSNIGQSWLRPPELMQTFKAAITTLTPEAEKIRAVTDMITKDASLIPIYEPMKGIVMRPEVIVSFNKGELSYLYMHKIEDFWLNK
jgi:peptide/nickel transport system substrate-binding protein